MPLVNLDGQQRGMKGHLEVNTMGDIHTVFPSITRGPKKPILIVELHDGWPH